MTIAGKLNALVITVVFSMSALVCGFSAVRDYSVERSRVIDVLVRAVRNRVDLPLNIFNSDSEARAALSIVLSELETIEPVYSGIIYDSQGQQLASYERAGVKLGPQPKLNSLRRNLSAIEPGIVSLDGEFRSVGTSVLDAVLSDDNYIHLALPITSGVNPLGQDFSPNAVVSSMAMPASARTRYVVGYAQLAVNQRALLYTILQPLGALTALCLLFAILSVLVSLRLTRNMTAPLSRLARVADQVAAGEPVEPLAIQGSGEVKQIAAVLNGVLSGMTEYKTRLDVDHQLLSMKVEERSEQLSKRNEELSDAVKQVTRTQSRLRKLAYYDSLTSLPNRRLFTEQLSLLLRLAKRNGDLLALLFLDLDNFKRINDSLGHSAGDKLLREVGSRLSSCIRDSDLLAHYSDTRTRIDVSRLGGDEFTVVLNQIDTVKSASVLAQRIIYAITAPMLIDGHELVVTPSIGIAVAPLHAEDVESLLRAADTAMYHAKKAGKGSYLLYRSDMDAAEIDRLKLENDLRYAIGRNELRLHYQPQVDAITGTVVGAEALVRWEHPEKGLISPFHFIPLAEEMGLIVDIGDWVLGEACRQMKEFSTQGMCLPKIAVNVSALQFTASFNGRVKEVLEQTGIAASSLELEMTEAVVMGDTNASIQALLELKEMGVSLSIDDFGTGYSSLSYLSRFPLDELKIDRSFVIESQTSESDAKLVIAIISMAKSLGLRTVAEGVETHEQFDFMTRNGAHVIQGYLFSKPVPAQELAELLSPEYFLAQVTQIREQLKKPKAAVLSKYS